MLPQKAIDEFKEIYKKEFGKELSDKEAKLKANELMELFRVLLKPTPKKAKRKKAPKKLSRT